ncbi:hypothetical protein AJ79_04808 [Helicocarpus griseus UAMH5409]|uniref:Geranylgeranyl pyrophosphate synthetase n=1 Tax=Helicocarpus griseus UAMH5409 TaxID=1447875 RepID=A0A2B7XRE8_9EURO|nr:hypothetical protein AJ79_04808 [Helicocarpus griseus UAMH5409]
MDRSKRNFDWEAARLRRKIGETSAVRGNAENRQTGEDSQPRGNRRGAQNGSRPPRYVKREQPPLAQPDGSLVGTIRVEMSPNLIEIHDPRITKCELVGSYNWLDRKSPVILIPGAPPKWTPLQGSTQLKKDAGDYFREPNAARWPKYPMEPAIRAVFDRNPNFDGRTIDIVTCGGTMGNLYKFASSVPWDFQCFAHLVGNTLFLVRKERTPKEMIQGICGYGHTFPETYTSWDPTVKGSATNQRIVRYEFGGLTFLVRFESDGYLGDMVKTEDEKQNGKKVPDPSDLDILTRNVAIGRFTPIISKTLEAQHAGFDVPQEAIFDLKTRVWRKKVDMKEALPRLWARQIQNFVVAHHDGGVFRQDDIHIKKMKRGIETWEKENETVLLRLAKVFGNLINCIKESKAKNLLIHRNQKGPLELWETSESSRSALPTTLCAKWEGVGENGHDDDDDNGGGDYLLF